MGGRAARTRNEANEWVAAHNATNQEQCQSLRLTRLLSRIGARQRIIRAAAQPFIADAIASDSAVWTLLVARDGRIELTCNHTVVAELTAHAGAEVLRMDEVPFERAEDVMICITSELPIPMDEIVRSSLEADLARWLAQNF
ncbi:MAG: hypothetical protein WBV39_16420 [Rudaea sp.]